MVDLLLERGYRVRAMDNLAARNNAMLPMMWVQALAPGMICGWLLFGQQWLDSRRQPVAAQMSA
jgi:lipopolysaccharide export system permease protein